MWNVGGDVRHAFAQDRVSGGSADIPTDAYTVLNAHFGGLDWEKVIPADLSKAAISCGCQSPTRQEWRTGFGGVRCKASEQCQVRVGDRSA